MMYRVRNDQTGEMINVPEEQLGQYGLDTQGRQIGIQTQQPNLSNTTQVQNSPLLDQALGKTQSNLPPNITGHSAMEYYNLLPAVVQSGNTKLIKQLQDNIKTELQYQKDILSGGYGESGLGGQLDPKVQAAEKYISILEKTYFENEAGQLEPLSYGKAGEPLSQYGGLLEKGRSLIVRPDENTKASRYLAYEDLKKSGLAQMAKASGDAANIAVAEQIMQSKSLAGGEHTKAEAIKRFKNIREKFGLPESDILKRAESESTDIKTTQPNVPLQNQVTNNIGQVKENVGNIQDDTFSQRLSNVPEYLKKLIDSGEYQKTLSGQALKEQIGQPNLKIPVLDQILGLSSGTGAGIGEGPMQITKGVATGNKYDIGVGGAKTALSIAGGSNVKPVQALVFASLGGLISKISGKGFSEGAGEGIASSIQWDGLNKYLSPALKKVFKPMENAMKNKDIAIKSADASGTIIGDSKGVQKIAKDLLKTKFPDYQELPIIKKLASGKTITPSEADNLLIRIGNKVFTKGGDFKTNQAASYYDVLRDELRKEFETKIPKVLKFKKIYSEALPKAAKELEPYQRLIQSSTRQLPGAIGTTAGLALLYKLGIFGGGGGGGNQY